MRRSSQKKKGDDTVVPDAFLMSMKATYVWVDDRVCKTSTKEPTMVSVAT